METNQYLDLFLEESTEHLQAINDHLLKLENHPEDTAVVGEIFRSAHTLKGMAATMGYSDIAELTHEMENVLDLLRNEKIHVTTNVVDVIFQSLESLEEMVASIREGGQGNKDVSALVDLLNRIEKGDVEAAPVKPVLMDGLGPVSECEHTVITQAKSQGFEAYAISVTIDENCVLKGVRAYMVFEELENHGEVIKTVPDVEALENEQFDNEFRVLLISKAIEEEIKLKLLNISEVVKAEVDTFQPEQANLNQPDESARAEKSGDEPKTKPSSAANQAASKTIRVNIERIDQLMNLFEELIIDRGRLEDISARKKDPELNETVEKMVRVSSDLQSLILKMRMVPVEQVFNRFPRMVRGLAKDLDKEIQLTIIGAETELDRTVIDEIGDPLVHLIRNSIDHGIEAPEVRKKNGKNPEGNVTLRAYQSGNHVFIEIEDDGAGINREAVINKAVEKGIIAPEDAPSLTDSEVYQLLFSSGFSTAEQISDISGRGVGLDVVKNKIELLGGTITTESKPGNGTLFSIKLPLTLSILSAMLVKVEDETYAVPLSSILETATIDRSQVMKTHGQEVIDYRDKVIPLVTLRNVLNVPQTTEKQPEKNTYSILVVKKGSQMTALAVDSFIGKREIVLKSLGDYIKNVFAISGATILGDGNIALILDTNDLIK
ncbi:chemotaxis protein CheA [Peribacillus glennii]|uniref:Chemotaxis protein CheA n=1 Tax=Peribacillus glennii TaxID=2303991 RepID=A0A372LF39_9BACI|nr:chemotaxis protein CheA [Peribacillus glennii]RFU63920.1 chemotaxis protein CheA [Peribacillus glennii]